MVRVSQSLARKLGYCSVSAAPFQPGTERVGFLPDVTHADGDGQRWRRGSAGDVAGFFSANGQNLARRRRRWTAENKIDAAAVHLAARTHALDDFLAGVAALGVADVRVLQAGFVRDLLFAEVVAEPRNALLEPRCAKRGIAHRAAACSECLFQQEVPDLRQMWPLEQEFGAGDFSGRPARHGAGERADAGFLHAELGQRVQIDASEIGNQFGCCGAFECERAVALGLVSEGDIVHDDEFVERFDEPLANHRVGDAEERVGQSIGFEFGKDVPLGIEQQGNDAAEGREILNIVGEDGVEIADAVGAGKGKIRAVGFVDERDALLGKKIFAPPIAEIIGQNAAEPDAEICAGGAMQIGERRVQDGLGSGGFHILLARQCWAKLRNVPVYQSRCCVLLPRLQLPVAPEWYTAPMADRNPAIDAPHERFIQITIPVGMLQCNCSIIGDPVTREALVVDPGDEVSRILELLGRHKLTVKAIVSTHAHIDHVGGLTKLHQYTGAPVMMHRDDIPLYQGMDIQAAFLGVAPPEVGEVDQLLTDGDVLQWGSLAAQVMHTPGHSPGSVSLYVPPDAGKLSTAAPQLFAGDTLFAGSIGRTDLWGGSMEQILASLRGKVLQLPDDTVVHPGHGPRTTIGEERQSNPFLTGK
jgi:hydroxyacylglutathione hydrolase